MLRIMLGVAALVSMIACENKSEPKEGPLITVIKLQSAETLLDLDEAKQYLDVDRAYGKFANDTLTAEKAWENGITFFWHLAQDKKFTNVFRYSDYSISEMIESSKGRVNFEAKNPNASIKKIVYHLELGQKQWTVVDIEYTKRDE